MRSLFLLLAAASMSAAGEQSWPGRYNTPPKVQGLAVQGLWGHPEMQPSHGHTAAFSADGKLGLYAWGGGEDGDGATDDGFLSLWDVGQARPVKEVRFARQALTAVALAPDAKQALVGLLHNDGKGKEARALAVVDLASGKETVLEKDNGVVFAAAWAADGKRALVSTFTFADGKNTGSVSLWDVAAGKKVRSIAADMNSPVLSLAFVPGQEQAVLAMGAQVKLWDLEKKEPGAAFKPLKDAGDAIMSLVVSPDGKRAASASIDFVLRLWDLPAGKEIGSLRKNAANQGMVSMAILDDRVLSAWTGFDAATGTQEDCELVLWDGKAGKELWSRKAGFKGMVPMHAAAGGKQVIMGGGPNPFTAIDIASGKEERVWGPPTTAVNAIVALDKNKAISAGHDGTLRFWDKGDAVKVLRAHGDAINALALSQDGQFLVTASADKTLKLWEVGTGVLRKTFTGHTGNVTSVVFSPDMHWIVSGSNDRTVKIWDVVAARELQALTGHAEGVNAVALAPDTNWVASASDDMTIRLWPLTNAKLDTDRDDNVLEAHKRQVTALAYSPDGKYLLSGSQDKTIKLWDAKKGKVLQTLEGHKNWISSVRFLGGNQVAASTADDLTVRLWDVFKGKETGQLDLGPNSDCPRCLAVQDANNLLVGTSGWVILHCTRK